MTTSPTFLLVHGSWHGPWCWERLQGVMEERGIPSRTVALPSVGTGGVALGGLAEDAAAVSEAAASVKGDLVVVGHSYGGAVISAASFGDNLRHLIYLAAFMPDAGRTFVSYFPEGPLPPYVILNDDGTMEANRAVAHETFYNDCDADTAAWATARLRPQSQSVMTCALPRAAWQHHPTTYILATQDRVLPPDFQRQFASRAGTAHEIATSHSPMLSVPEALCDLIQTIASPAPVRA